MQAPHSPDNSHCTDKIYYNHTLRYPLATFYSIGKLFQAAGQDTLGILRLFAYLKSTDAPTNDSLLAILVSINFLINLSTRANKIFEYCLLPTVYWISNINTISKDDGITGYIIDGKTDALYHMRINLDDPKLINLADTGERQLIEFKTTVLSKRPTLIEEQNIFEISQHFTAEEYSKFNKIIKKRDLPSNWNMPTKLLYFFLYSGCAISTVFSGMTAYLSGVTLGKACYSKLSSDWEIVIGSYVALCAILAYVSFNLKTMRKSVTDTCQSFNDGISGKGYGIPVRAMQWTILTTFCGVFASFGMAYFSMSNAVTVLPWIKTLPIEWQNAIIYTNVVISFFPSVFNFASGCYTQIKNITPKNTDENIDFSQHALSFFGRLTWVTLLLSFMILIDSTSNSFGTFLGTNELLEKFFNPQDSQETSEILLGVTILITASNIFLNFGMIMTGTEETFQKCNNWCGGNKNLLYQTASTNEDHLKEDIHNPLMSQNNNV